MPNPVIDNTYDLNCPHCDKLYKLSRDKVVKHVGKQIRCRQCAKSFKIPAIASEDADGAPEPVAEATAAPMAAAESEADRQVPAALIADAVPQTEQEVESQRPGDLAGEISPYPESDGPTDGGPVRSNTASQTPLELDDPPPVLVSPTSYADQADSEKRAGRGGAGIIAAGYSATTERFAIDWPPLADVEEPPAGTREPIARPAFPGSELPPAMAVEMPAESVGSSEVDFDWPGQKSLLSRPVIPEPIDTTSVTRLPRPAKPDDAERIALEPVAVESVGFEPVALEPVVAKPVGVEPVVVKPAAAHVLVKTGSPHAPAAATVERPLSGVAGETFEELSGIPLGEFSEPAIEIPVPAAPPAVPPAAPRAVPTAAPPAAPPPAPSAPAAVAPSPQPTATPTALTPLTVFRPAPPIQAFPDEAMDDLAGIRRWLAVTAIAMIFIAALLAAMLLTMLGIIPKR